MFSLGVELVSRATYISRKRGNVGDETATIQGLQERAEREAKRKLMAQPEISHEAAEQIFRSGNPRTDENFPGIIHVSHQLALLHGHDNVFFCEQSGAFHAGGTLKLLKSLCDGTGESRQKARRKLKRGLMPNEAHFFIAAQFFLYDAGCFDSPRIVNLISHQKKEAAGP